MEPYAEFASQTYLDLIEPSKQNNLSALPADDVAQFASRFAIYPEVCIAAALSGNAIPLREQFRVQDFASVALGGEYFRVSCRKTAIGVASPTQLSLVNNQLEFKLSGGKIGPTLGNMLRKEARGAVEAMYRAAGIIDEETFALGITKYAQFAELRRGVSVIEVTSTDKGARARVYEPLGIVCAARVAHAMRSDPAVPPIGYTRRAAAVYGGRWEAAGSILQDFDRLAPQLEGWQQWLLGKHFPNAYKQP